MALDYGDARIGVAATDPVGIAVHGVGTVSSRQPGTLSEIEALIQAKQIRRIILGLPLRIDGTEGSACEKVRKFGKELSIHLDEHLPQSIPMDYYDERFTTMSASKKLHQAGNNAKQQKSIIDQAAAMEILQDWLEKEDPLGWTLPPLD